MSYKINYWGLVQYWPVLLLSLLTMTSVTWLSCVGLPTEVQQRGQLAISVIALVILLTISYLVVALALYGLSVLWGRIYSKLPRDKINAPVFQKDDTNKPLTF